MGVGLKPLEFTDCLTDSPYFRENLHYHERELEKTSQQIKRLVKEVKDLLLAAKSECSGPSRGPPRLFFLLEAPRDVANTRNSCCACFRVIGRTRTIFHDFPPPRATERNILLSRSFLFFLLQIFLSRNIYEIRIIFRQSSLFLV